VRAAQGFAAERFDADEHLEATGARELRHEVFLGGRSGASHWTKKGRRIFSSIIAARSSPTSGYLLKLSEVNITMRIPPAVAALRLAIVVSTGWLRTWRSAILTTEQKLQV
jgi:hypothetical protein